MINSNKILKASLIQEKHTYLYDVETIDTTSWDDLFTDLPALKRATIEDVERNIT